MATRQKGKGKTKAKRKKTPVTKAATRRKTTAVKKTRTIRKKPAEKAPVRRASPKKAKSTAKAAVKPTPARPPAQHMAARTMPSPPAQPTPPRERVAVTRYYIYVTRGGDTRDFFWEADNEEEARLLVGIWNETPAQCDELYFIEPYEEDD